MSKFYSLLIFTFFSFSAFSQALYNDGTITIEDAGLIFVNGDVEITDNGTVTPDGTLQIKGDLQQDGTLTYGASGDRLVVFDSIDATRAQNITSNNGVVEFHNLRAYNPSVLVLGTYNQGGVTSNVDIQVNGDLDVNNGDLIMWTNELILGSDASISNADGNNVLYFTSGSCNWELSTLKTYSFPIYREGAIGYVPVEIDVQAMPASGDVIKVGFTPQSNLGNIFHTGGCPGIFGTPGNQTIMLNKLVDNFGYWQVDAFDNGGTYVGQAAGWDYDITVHYPEPVLSNFQSTYGADYFKVLKVDNYAGTTPIAFNPSTADWYSGVTSTGFYCSGITDLSTYNFATGITSESVRSFSNFGGAGNNGGGGLPVELLYLEANAMNNNYIQLDWATAVEIDNSGFEVMRSVDGINFTNIGWIDGNGNTTTQQYYTFSDMDVVSGTVYYYRLNQVDYDGDNELTYIVSASLVTDNVFAIGEFVPNPTYGGTSLDINTSDAKEISVKVFNTLGQIVAAEDLNLTVGMNKANFELNELAAGTYYAVITVDNQVYNKKLVIAQR